MPPPTLNTEEPAIRRRRRSGPAFSRALPRPVPRLTAVMLDGAENPYKNGEILRVIGR